MQRKVFRIEQMNGNRRVQAPAVRPAPQHRHSERTGSDDAHTLRRELDAIHEMLTDNMRTLSALLQEGKERRMTRAAGELGAAIDAMEKATGKILQSAEVIDDCAKAFASSRKGEYESGLAQDIQDNLMHIYKACNFQDLAGQRIGKVIEILGEVEERVTRLIERNSGLSAAGEAPAAPPASKMLNGPRLDGDSGHASQHDIDAMFD